MSRTRTRRLVVAAALLVVVVVLAGGWIYDHFAVNAAERNLVGTWSQTRDNGADIGGVLVEFVVRQDRTVQLINRDANTGAVTLALEEYDWWRVCDGVLTLRRRPEVPPARPWFAWWGRPRRVTSYDELRITPDGPDRIRYTVLRADSLNALPGRLPTGTWTRLNAE